MNVNCNTLLGRSPIMYKRVGREAFYLFFGSNYEGHAIELITERDLAGQA
jgi:hypothetical protein